MGSMRRNAVICAVLLSLACASRPVDPTVEPGAVAAPPRARAPAAPRGGGPLRLVLREGMLTEPGSGEIFVEIDRPVEVEAAAPLPPGFQARDLPLRVLLPGGGYVDTVRAGDGGALMPDDPTAAGLYVGRETTLWHQPGEGELGTAAAGAFLPLFALQGEWARVALPGYLALEADRGRRSRAENQGGAALAWVRCADLTTQAPAALPASDPWTTPAFDYNLLLRDSPEGQAFSQLRCGPVRELRRERGWSLVAQLRQGVEVRGWVDRPPLPGRGSGACPHRTVVRADDQWSVVATARPASPKLPPASAEVSALGPGGSVLRGSDGRELGHLPAGAVLEAELGAQTGRLRVGPVVVAGSFDLGQLVGASEGPLLSQPAELEDPSPRPAPVWREVSAPGDIGPRFLKQVLGQERQLWMRVPADRGGGCRPLSFTRPRFEGEKLVSETREVVDDPQQCLRRVVGYQVELQREEARLTLFGPSLRFERMPGCTPQRDEAPAGPDAAGCAWMLQVVGMEKDRVLVAPVGNSVLKHYAVEDLGAWFFERAACEADPRSLITPMC